MNLKFYVLQDRQVVEATMEEWSRFLASPDRFVGQWTFGDDIFVSTVFLGIELHPGQVFETMVFGGPMDGHQERTSTWLEAERTHERVCAMVTKRVLQ